MPASRGASIEFGVGCHDTATTGPQVPGKGWTSVGRLQAGPPRDVIARAAASGSARAGKRARRATRSAFAVEADLLANDVIIDAAAQIVLQAVGQGHDHVVDASVLDQLRQQLASLRGVVLPREITNHVQGEVAREVKYRVVEQVGDKLFHRGTSRGGG